MITKDANRKLDASEKRENAILRRMLDTPPKPHKKERAKKERWITGTIRKAQIFARALSEKEINALYEESV